MKSTVLLLLAFMITGCGGPSENPGTVKPQTSQSAPAEPGTTGKVTISVWENYANEEHDFFVRMAREYEQSHPGISVEVSQIPWADHMAKYRTSLTVNAAPDIGRIEVGNLAELASNDALFTLDDLGVRDVEKEYLPAAFASNVYKGKVYGLPDQITGVCLFCNKKLFIEAGLDPDKPPTTWDEFIETAKKLTDPAKQIWGFGMDNGLWWSFPFFNTFGAKFISEDGKKCLLDSPQAIQAFQLKVDLYRKHKVEGGAWLPGAINSEIGFLNGRYAMVLMGPWNVKNFQKAGIDFSVSLIPSGPAGTSTNVGGTDMVLFKSSKHPKEAYDFLRFVSGADYQAEWSSKLSQIPTNLLSNSIISPSENPIISIFITQMKTAVPRPSLKFWLKCEEIMAPEMEAAISGKKTVQEALASAVSRINQEVLPLE
ncbi:MAG: extracellular solute-binding protein [Candidatus Wallbacteria bacterium]|nr:extracellular solute-binding protein [Candidatus Wallbacteria bacterium]